MANPIVAILSIAGVVGAGGAAVAVNNEVFQKVSQDPVVVTVEGEPVVIGGGTELLLPKQDNKAPSQVVTRQVQTQQQTQTQAQAPQPTVEAPAPAQPPATHTGASGSTGNTGGDDDGRDTEDVEDSEYEDDSYESSQGGNNSDDNHQEQENDD